MPIVDIEIVGSAATSAQALADAMGEVFGAAPGKVWVKLRSLPRDHYAENGGGAPAPVFVTVTASAPPAGAELRKRIEQINAAVARLTHRPAENVHVEFLPAARGRIAFGGRLVE